MGTGQGVQETVEVVETPWDRGILWTPGLSARGRSVGALLEAFREQVYESLEGGWVPASVLWTGLKAGAATIAAGFGGYYRGELVTLAELSDSTPTDVLLANLAYDLSNGAAACSTFAARSKRATLHARNLDWTFPRRLLEQNTVVAKVLGAPKGDYALVTWPGFFGGLTAVAKRRFSVSVNFVQHPDCLDVGSFIARALGGYWPVPWLVRQALDTCEDYGAAVELLKSAKVLAPVLFTVAGTKLGELVVIERTPDEGRKSKADPVWITNHYAWSELASSNVQDEIDSKGRFLALLKGLGKAAPQTPERALELLSGERLLKEDTVQQVAMSAAEGALWVRIPGGPVTHVTL